MECMLLAEKEEKQMSKFFIPSIRVLNDVQVPSTPFKDKQENAIYLGDVVEVSILDDPPSNSVTFLVDLVNGSYVLTKPNTIEPLLLGEVDAGYITILGSSVSEASLLEKL